MRVYAEAGMRERFQRLPLLRESNLSPFQSEVRIEVQPALRHDAWFESSDGARGRVSWIDRGRKTLLLALLVQLQECRVGQNYLTANLEALREPRSTKLFARDRQRHRAYRADIAGDVFPRDSIAARQSSLQLRCARGTRFILQRQRNPIHLQL